MKKLFWFIVWILLIPLWTILFLGCVVGFLAEIVWEGLYEPIYDLSGKPLDTKR